MEKMRMPIRLERKVIYESEWICLYADKVQMPDGRIVSAYHKLHYPKESVCVVIMNEKDEFLLIQSRRYVISRLEWEIPAGSIELGEKLEEAAKREVLEETGCTLKELAYLCCYNPSNGMSDLKMHVFAAKVEGQGDILDRNEVYCKRWFSKAEIQKMLKNNETQCGVSMHALLYVLQFYV